MLYTECYDSCPYDAAMCANFCARSEELYKRGGSFNVPFPQPSMDDLESDIPLAPSWNNELATELPAWEDDIPVFSESPVRLWPDAWKQWGTGWLSQMQQQTDLALMQAENCCRACHAQNFPGAPPGFPGTAHVAGGPSIFRAGPGAPPKELTYVPGAWTYS